MPKKHSYKPDEVNKQLFFQYTGKKTKKVGSYWRVSNRNPLFAVPQEWIKFLCCLFPFPLLMPICLCSAAQGISFPTIHTSIRDPTILPSITFAAPLPGIHTEVHPKLNQTQEQVQFVLPPF